MSKAADIAKTSAKGSFNYLWGLVISTVISAAATIFVARLLGSDLYGLYVIVLIVPTLIGNFRDWGLNYATVQFTAQYRSEGREEEIRSVLMSGLLFEIILGIILSFVSFMLAGFLADSIFHRPSITPLIQVASLVILANGLVSAASGAFTGVERMAQNSIMLIVQSIVKAATMIGLVILGFSTTGATVGYTVGVAAGGAVGVILMWTIYKKLPKPPKNKLQIKAYIMTMFTYGIPLSISVVLVSIQTQFFAFLLPIYYTTSNVQIGNYGIAGNLVVLIAFFSQPITIMLFPAFSKLNPEKDKEALKNVFQYSVKYAALIVVPAAAIVMSLSQPAVNVLFGNSYQTAGLYLTLLSLTYFFSAFGSISITNFINSQGKTTYQMKLAILTAAIGFPLGYGLIMQFGVLGLIVVSLVDGLPSLFISLKWIKKHYDLTVDWNSSARILLSSAIAGGLTYLIISELQLASWIELLVGIITFCFILVCSVVLTQAINDLDINNLRTMASELGPITALTSYVLNIVEKANNRLDGVLHRKK